MTTSNASQFVNAADDLIAHGAMSSFGGVLSVIDATDRHVSELAPAAPEKVNRFILDGYYALSEGLGPLLHGADPVANATFATFAMWTTETLRSEIDRQEGRPLSPYGIARPGRGLYRRAAKLVLGRDDVIARNLALGEAAIYDELGSAIRELIRSVLQALDKPGPGGEPDWQRVWQDYTQGFEAACTVINQQRQSPELPDSMGAKDVMVLQEVVLPYFEVMATQLTRKDVDDKGRKLRAELILLGSIRLEAYAQTRVRPVLERNLSYLPDALRAVVGSRLTGRNTFTARQLRKAYGRYGDASEILDEAFEIAATRHVYTLLLGDEELSFGRDLPLPPPANPVLRDRQPAVDQERYAPDSFFPRDLETLESRGAWAAWRQFDRSGGEGSRTAVDNWLRYEERLNFIVNFMRSRQQLTALYGPPRSIPPPIPPRPARLAPVAPRESSATRSRVQILGVAP
jgi:hypothetical protein